MKAIIGQVCIVVATIAAVALALVLHGWARWLGLDVALLGFGVLLA